MTVDENPVTSPSPQSAAKLQQKKLQEQVGGPLIGGQLVEGRPILQPRPQNQQTPERPTTFEQFLLQYPSQADSKINQLAEVTGCQDKLLLVNAFNETRTENQEFSVTAAIDWILKVTETKSFPAEIVPVGSVRRPTRENTMSPAVVTHSPSSAHAVVPPNSPNSANKQVVDLTESSPKEVVDEDYEKAIQLSLAEANRSGFGVGQISQEEQDVSRALEASLLETPLGGAKRKRNENWIDPLNPHERERNGLWPVGLKNVGQTCWFSAVIQSLFYLPAFRSLVFNYQPPPSFVTEIVTLDEDSNKKTTVSAFDERKKKIIEFMLELRRLFALLVASQRRYVDPSRAVDILRGSIGNGNGTLSNLNCSPGGSNSIVCLNDNDQQDVSEFTHIVLEWVEEAFKEPDCSTSESGFISASLVSEMMDEGSNDQGEKENNEEKDPQTSKPDFCVINNSNNKDNPMAKLFYGKVLSEGNIKGLPFSKIENFGQWPLQVNSFTHIHDSLENSTAQEYFDVSSTGSGTNDSETERWFKELPPVLFLELSRFQYNMERRVAEKIHNKLEFAETIFMDRYMSTNKAITRTKREEVRALKERRRVLKDRLKKFTDYGVSSSNELVQNHLPLPDVLKFTMTFALNGANVGGSPAENSSILSANAVPFTDRTASPANKPLSAFMMQVDSPCPSPKMTPASSVTNLAFNPNQDQEISPMEVESNDEDMPTPCHQELRPFSEGCETSTLITTTTITTVGDVIMEDPAPRSISETEMKILQNCLSRWIQEVEEDIRFLESSIDEIEKTIENMYDSVEGLRKLEYGLHAVMVHEGSIDSGHYWAYVRDHKRKVWLKFNDNTVSEVTWEELFRESVGGHSNTSAYSLVYIDSSKPELLLDSEVNSNVTYGDQVEVMDEGSDPETLLKYLPQDLADYVVQDNHLFRQEVMTWDKDQEEKKEAASKMQKQQQTDADPNNEVEVVQEKLTYTNNHARLSIDLSTQVIQRLESTVSQKGASVALPIGVENVIQHYLSAISKTQDLVSVTSSHSAGKAALSEMAPVDVRLESFVAYLLRNNISPQSSLIELAVLEQLAHPGLKKNDESVAFQNFREHAEHILTQKQTRLKEEAAELKDWHQTYHWFRRSAHSLVNGLEAFFDQKFDKALGCFTDSYHFTMKVEESKPVGPFKSLRPGTIIKFLCLTLPEVNNNLIQQFNLSECLQEVVHAVQQLVVPCLAILLSRIKMNQLHGGTIECVRNDWCALLARDDAKADAGTALTEILSGVLDLEPEVLPQTPVRLPKNGENVNLNADLRLSAKYKILMEKAKNFDDQP